MVLPIFVFNLVNIVSELYQIVPPHCGADRRAVPQAHQSRDNDGGMEIRLITGVTPDREEDTRANPVGHAFNMARLLWTAIPNRHFPGTWKALRQVSDRRGELSGSLAVQFYQANSNTAFNISLEDLRVSSMRNAAR